MRAPRSIVLLRVGIDTGSGGMVGPIFEDGSFEFIPIDADRDRLGRTYGNTRGLHGRKLIDYFPDRLKGRMKDSFMHADPEFDTFTYGDPTRPKQSLKRLGCGDLVVFYAGLAGWGSCAVPPGLYIIGFFVIERAGKYQDLKRERALKPFTRNWHLLNEYEQGRLDRLVLVKGGKGSRLLRKAVKISAGRKAIDRGGHPIFVLDPRLRDHFGDFTKLNAIQRSTPRWVKEDFCGKAAKFVLALK